MWGLILAVCAIAIATDCEARIKKLQDRLWETEKLALRLREELAKGSG